ncbi:MAG TPA: hypothetical protein VFP45_01365 [Candidatus Nitrosotalea sp.]|nr:hypothetical protein [Candidatus Nitrosotalea sp.]
MYSIYKNEDLKKLLVISLIGSGFIILTSTFFGKEIGETVTDITYVITTGIFVTLAFSLVLRFKKTGSHGKSWLFFLGAAVSWCLAETSWTVYELIYKQNPFPSIADGFYIAGYPLMLGFLVYYLKPVKKAITKKMLIISILISLAISIPSISMAYSSESNVSVLENVLATAYPVLDSIIFVPAILGISLFFRGEVNFPWSLICIGILCFAVGDIGFQFTTFTNTYYTGNPVDMILIWAYIFFSFGSYYHIRMYRKNESPVQNEDLDRRY